MSVEVVGRSVILSRSLPWTKTHKNGRSYRLVSPAVHEPTGQAWLFSVTITQGKKDTEVYLCDEIAAEGLPPGWRRFYMVCQSREPTPDRPGAYAIDVDPAGIPQRCECKGSVTRMQGTQDDPPPPLADDRGEPVAMTCKHKDLFRDLFRLGFFDPVGREDLPTAY